MHVSGIGASRKDVFEATNSLAVALQRTINHTGLVSIIVASIMAIAGIVVELSLRADFGYVLIAIGVLGISVGYP